MDKKAPQATKEVRADGDWGRLSGQAPRVTAAIVLSGIYIACELIANITASKPVAVGSIVVPAAVFIYALTFTLVDLINERMGKDGARKVVYTAFAANILLAGNVQLSVNLPPAPFYQAQVAFRGVLGSTPRIVAASLSAYMVSSLIDIEVFAWWRERVGGYRWARVLASNAVSTLIDSIIFITVGFWGVFPVLPLIRGQYIVKMAVTGVSLPLIYLVRAARPSVAREAEWK
jgi:uncharacterized integral membrane protein (TIGR00697 family)